MREILFPSSFSLAGRRRKRESRPGPTLPAFALRSASRPPAIFGKAIFTMRLYQLSADCQREIAKKSTASAMEGEKGRAGSPLPAAARTECAPYQPGPTHYEKKRNYGAEENGEDKASGLVGQFRRLGFAGGRQGGGQFFVEGEKEFHALAFGVKASRAVTAVHGAVRAWRGL